MKQSVVLLSVIIASIQVFASTLQIDSAVELRWESKTGMPQQIQYSTNLTSGIWHNLGEVTQNSTNQVFDSTRENSTRYYRVVDTPNTSIVGIFEATNYPSADSGKWHFFEDNTFVSDFVESTHSMSCGTYSYSSNQLTLIFMESTNPNLIGETEIHNNVIVSNDLYFSEANMSFIRKQENSTTEIVCDWYGTLMGNGQSTDPGAESDVAGFFLLEENTSLILGLEYYGPYPGHYVFSSGSISGQGTSFDNTRIMTFFGSVSNNTMTGVFMKSDGPGGTFEVTKNVE